jgi:hypothetical protein
MSVELLAAYATLCEESAEEVRDKAYCIVRFVAGLREIVLSLTGRCLGVS